jgi:precorrin-3B synthase
MPVSSWLPVVLTRDSGGTALESHQLPVAYSGPTSRRAGSASHTLPSTYDPAVPTPAHDVRNRADMCPGALTVHEAADGGLARVRVPGGIVSAPQFRALADASSELGDGRLELTSRGNVQIRALPTGAEAELGERLAEVGLLPSFTHERVRNIVASPLAGIDAESDLTDLVLGLDRALCAEPRLAALPGRFLFAVDDGRGDVAQLAADITLIADGPRARIETLDVPISDAVSTIIAFALAFLDERRAQGSSAWRVGELDGGGDRIANRARRTLAGVGVRDAPARPVPAPTAEPVGVIAQHDGGTALAVLAPLGRLSADQATFLAGHGGRRGLRITPWRSLVLPDLADADAVGEQAEQAGMGIDPTSAWYRLSACTGRPGCAKARADVQADAGTTPNRWPARQVHWSGCERRCGRPVDTEVDVVATDIGYRINERTEDGHDSA